MADVIIRDGMVLEVLTLADLDPLHRIFSDPETHTIGDGPATSIELTREWLRRREQRRQESGVAWYAIRDGSGTMIGNAGVFMGRTAPHPELGFEVQKAWQGQGVGRAAARVVVEEAHRAGFEQIWATVRDWNRASIRALDAVGFTRHHVERDSRSDLVYLQHCAD